MVDYETIWNILPFPAFVIDEQDYLIDANGAGELLVQTSRKQMRRKRISDVFGTGSVIEDTANSARQSHGSLMQYNVDVAPVDQPSQSCNVHIGVMGRGSSTLLLIIQPTGVAQKMSRSLTHLAASRSVAAMAAMLAHEIRNPLAGISGAAQLLGMTVGEEDQELTEMITSETRRIGELVDRVEHVGDQREVMRKPVNIHDVLDRARRAAKAGFAAHVTFSVEYDPSLPDVAGDSDQLLQVFQNLLKNAAESVDHAKGTIKIRTSYNSGVKLAVAGHHTENLPLQIQVIDNGAGIPDALIGDIFDPFVTSKANGSGLGLPLVSKIIAAHGGLIECSSTPARTEFCVRLPVWRAGMEKT